MNELMRRVILAMEEAQHLSAKSGARLVLQAVREPTDGMKDCGIDAGWFFDTYGTSDRGREAAANLWRNMVDEALEQ